MIRHLTPAEAYLWRRLAARARAAEAALAGWAADLVALGEVGTPAWEALQQAEDGLAGLAYRLNPQGEWLGGTKDLGATADRPPHLSQG